MNPQFGVEMRPELICSCCQQPYYPDKVREDLFNAILIGVEEYAICPVCTQAVPDHLVNDRSYRLRCRSAITRLEALAKEQQLGRTSVRKAELTYEELKARVAELEKVTLADLSFKVGPKRGVSVYGLGRFPVTLYYEQWVRLLDSAKNLRDFLELNKPKLKFKKPPS